MYSFIYLFIYLKWLICYNDSVNVQLIVLLVFNVFIINVLYLICQIIVIIKKKKMQVNTKFFKVPEIQETWLSHPTYE